jgi:hypothetical protein
MHPNLSTVTTFKTKLSTASRILHIATQVF